MKNAREVFLYFLRLGVTGFGGPLALAAQMQRDLVENRKWISQEEFQKAFALIKSMPGAMAFNTATYMGRRRGGWTGGFLAAIGLIAPAFFMILFFAYTYDTLTQNPWLEKFLMGMQAAALALIIAALRPLAGAFLLKKSFLFTGAVGAALFAVYNFPEPLLIIGGGIFWILWNRRKNSTTIEASVLVTLSLVCLKAGAFVFGSGIAIVPMLEKDFVTDLHWVTHSQFMDALAIGQVTPGPVLLTTTFLGFKVAGLLGAIVATISVYIVGFFHMMTWFPLAVNWLSKQSWISDFIFGALAMVIAAILVTVFRLAWEWRTTPFEYVILAGVLILLYRWKIPSWALVLIGGAAGLFLT